MNNLVARNSRLSDRLDFGEIHNISPDRARNDLAALYCAQADIERASVYGRKFELLSLQSDSSQKNINLVVNCDLNGRVVLGLLESSGDQSGISKFVTKGKYLSSSNKPRVRIYKKNGMLVGHAGRRINEEDVANALAEE